MDRVHVDLRISGKVQGVRYRKTAGEQAAHLHVTGYAMNMPDGSVLIEAEGERVAVAAFIAWCQKGPPWAEVYEVQVTDRPVQGYLTFTTRR